jgi:hypothetical protein
MVLLLLASRLLNYGITEGCSAAHLLDTLCAGIHIMALIFWICAGKQIRLYSQINPFIQSRPGKKPQIPVTF